MHYREKGKRLPGMASIYMDFTCQTRPVPPLSGAEVIEQILTFASFVPWLQSSLNDRLCLSQKLVLDLFFHIYFNPNEGHLFIICLLFQSINIVIYECSHSSIYTQINGKQMDKQISIVFHCNEQPYAAFIR